jgi:hypothetical protein
MFIAVFLNEEGFDFELNIYKKRRGIINPKQRVPDISDWLHIASNSEWYPFLCMYL